MIGLAATLVVLVIVACIVGFIALGWVALIMLLRAAARR